MKTKAKPKILNKGSLMTFMDGDVRRHLNYLFDFGEENGIHEPTIGRVKVTKAQAEEHNRLLSEGEVKGLDACPIGQGRDFYPSEDRKKVSTWKGEVLSTDVSVNGQVITFRRKGKVFRGRFKQHEDVVFFARIS